MSRTEMSVSMSLSLAALVSAWAILSSGCVARDYGAVAESLTGAQQGVDRAGAFSAEEAMKLVAAYPITFTGVYIGGPCSAGSGWTAASVTTLYDAVGWSFLPIFVGQQASSICGRDTLTEAQGVTDGKAALADMLAFQWAPGSHIPLALDLEAGTYSGDESAAIAYVKGWSDTVSAGGYDVYVYSSVVALNALAAQHLPITGAWPAYWLKTDGSYTAGLEPSAAPGLSSAWGNGGGWQYNSGTSVAGDVDYDVANFRMAPAPGHTLATDMALDDAAPHLDAADDDRDLSVGADADGPRVSRGDRGCATAPGDVGDAGLALVVVAAMAVVRRRRTRAGAPHLFAAATPRRR